MGMFIEKKINLMKIMQFALIITMILNFYNGAGLGGRPQDFDVFSDEVILADIIHDTTSGNRILLQLSGNEPLGAGNIKECLVEENTDYLTFFDYLSNIGLQSQFFRIMWNVLPFSTHINLQIIYLFNAVLMTLSTLLFLYCIKDYIGEKACYCVLCALNFISPTYINYGRNLYWLGYMIMLPFISSLLLCKYQYGKKNFYKYSFILGFIACAMKLLCSYEFVSGIMISCIIPYFLYSIKEQTNIKKVFFNMLYPSIGCLLGFVFALGVHAIFIKMTLPMTSLIEVMTSVFANRIYGDVNASNSLMAESARASVIELITDYLNMRCFDFMGLGINYREIIFLLLVSYAFVLQKGNNKIKMQIQPIFFSCVLSILAPISWLVLAKPHAYIHRTQCALLWYCPFMLLVLAYFAYVLLEFGKREKEE